MTVPQKRVLIADDDPEVRRLLSSVLGRRELVIDAAADGRQALDLLKENVYTVVLLDLLMPNVDGFAVLEALSSAVSPPVVLVITAADRSTLQQLDPRKVHGIVRKPFDPEELANVVVACAEIRSRSAFETMAISAMLAGGPFLAWLNRFSG